MPNHRLTGPAEQFVERMALAWESHGLPRIAGRILGYLSLQGDPASLDDIAAALGVSKASVSNDARRLAQMGVLERRSRPGDRRDYYTVSPDGFRHAVESRVENLRRFHGLIDEARAVAEDTPAMRERLAAWAEAHRMMQAAFEGILAELDARGAAGARGAGRAKRSG